MKSINLIVIILLLALPSIVTAQIEAYDLCWSHSGIQYRALFWHPSGNSTWSMFVRYEYEGPNVIEETMIPSIEGFNRVYWGKNPVFLIHNSSSGYFADNLYLIDGNFYNLDDQGHLSEMTWQHQLYTLEQFENLKNYLLRWY